MSDPTDADLIEEIASALPLFPDEPELAGVTISIMQILLRRPAEAWRDPDSHQDFTDRLDLMTRHGTVAQQEDRARYKPPV